MLELTGLVKRFGDVTALDGLTLAARPGRLVGFLGPNGSGKTTAMRAIFDLVQLDAGEVRWRGAPITAEQRRRFGYMPEQRGLYPRMPVEPQLVYLARLRGLERTDAEREARHWLERLGLAGRGNDAVGQLSHGNQQRVQLAAALVHRPDLLVLDEPFSGLDVLGVEGMSEVLRERAREGATVLFSSHQLDLVEELCDDVVIIAAGRARLSGTLGEVRAAGGYRTASVRLSDNPAAVRLQMPMDADVRDLLDRLEPTGRVESLAFGPPSLSEVFRTVVGTSVAEAESAAGSPREGAR